MRRNDEETKYWKEQFIKNYKKFSKLQMLYEGYLNTLHNVRILVK